MFEEAEGHDRVYGELPLIKEKEEDREEAENDEAQDCRASPGKRHTAVFETEKEHDGSTDYCD